MCVRDILATEIDTDTGANYHWMSVCPIAARREEKRRTATGATRFPHPETERPESRTALLNSLVKLSAYASSQGSFLQGYTAGAQESGPSVASPPLALSRTHEEHGMNKPSPLLRHCSRRSFSEEEHTCRWRRRIPPLPAHCSCCCTHTGCRCCRRNRHCCTARTNLHRSSGDGAPRSASRRRGRDVRQKVDKVSKGRNAAFA